MKYAIFQADGRILRTMSCNPLDIDLNVVPGEAYARVDDDVADNTHYINQDDDIVAMPEQPSPVHAFDYASGQWIDPRTLQQIRDVQWERIKAAREAEIDSPLVTPYGTFDSGPEDRSNITDAILLVQTLAGLGQPASIDFTLADNTTVTIGLQEIVTVGLLLGAKVQQAYGKSRVLRQQISDATTKEQIEAIQWTP